MLNLNIKLKMKCYPQSAPPYLQLASAVAWPYKLITVHVAVVVIYFSNI